MILNVQNPTWRHAFFMSVLFLPLILGSGSAKSQEAGDAPPDPSHTEANGEEIASTICATCHAIGKSGSSPHEDAPAFRDVFQNYPPEALEEALAQGIAVGHPDMPSFELGPEQIEELLNYFHYRLSAEGPD